MSEIFATVSALREALDYHTRRHNVLAGNLANVDTPGFKPFELLRASEAATEVNMPLTRTNAGHVQPAGIESATRGRTVEDRTVPAGADGNAVSLEHELSKLAANDIRFRTAAAIVKSRLAILRYVAMDGMGG